MPAQTETAAPICVDMDGTLIAVDVLHESALMMVRARPLELVKIPAWLLRGKANLKHQLAQRVQPDPAHLPYRADVLEFLHQQKQAGRKLILVTASNVAVARAVADHLGIFDDVIGSDDCSNCAGANKLATIRQKVGDQFEYIGDSKSDLPVWEAATAAHMVNPRPRLLRHARTLFEPQQTFVTPSRRLKGVAKAIRPLQWVKNLLVLLPLLLAHKAADALRVQEAMFAFVAFCLCASGVYVLNDLLDIELDRHHPRKRNRPFAAGILSVPLGVGLSFALLLVAFLAAATVSAQFAGMLGIYLVATSAYSFFFKGRLLMDVILLAGLYTHRLIAGAVAVKVMLSPWLLAFSMFFFISLAFVKRYSELQMLQLASQREARGRGYMVDDLEIIQTVGPTSGYLAVLVFCQYISSEAAMTLYRRPQVLWLVCPVLLYWITRVWFLARRRVLHDDPIIFAMKDRMSWITGAVVLVLVLAAMV